MTLKHNDNEIISLIREGNQDALELMFEKYSRFIYKKIHKFNLQSDKEDMYQEGLMMLYKSIKIYSPTFNKTFMRYFELNFERKLISILTKKVRRQEIMETNIRYIYEQNTPNKNQDEYFLLYIEEISKILTKTEKLVYTLRELKNYSIAYISQEYDIPEKVIYNSLYRAKQKISSHFAN